MAVLPGGVFLLRDGGRWPNDSRLFADITVLPEGDEPLRLRILAECGNDGKYMSCTNIS
jgi:hypothetical protein